MKSMFLHSSSKFYCLVLACLMIGASSTHIYAVSQQNQSRLIYLPHDIKEIFWHVRADLTDYDFNPELQDLYHALDAGFPLFKKIVRRRQLQSCVLC